VPRAKRDISLRLQQLNLLLRNMLRTPVLEFEARGPAADAIKMGKHPAAAAHCLCQCLSTCTICCAVFCTGASCIHCVLHYHTLLVLPLHPYV
jgi:hypothetical protein